MKEFFIDYLKNIIPVCFSLDYNGENQIIGKGTPEFTLKLTKMPDKRELLTSTSIALGEAYMRSEIDVDKDLYEVLNMFLSNMDKFTTNTKKLKNLIFSSLNKKNQKQEVQSHYDIGNDFYKLWLDETMSYSCAYFKNPDDTLYEAQLNKINHILEKLFLKEDMNILDIGCGWGSLLIEAAKKYKVRGLGITLSEEQYSKFKERIIEEQLEDYLDVKLMDYRELKKSEMKFDRIVSVGMLEHVGRGNYEEFMENVDSVLNKGGLFLLHYISALKEYPGDAWMKKYIFPGGVIPSLREIINILPDYNFYTLDVESLRRHYNKTLLCWRKNFLEHKEEIEESKGTEFVRMWDLYLSACAATFNNGIIDLHQILISKGINNEIPIHRII